MAKDEKTLLAQLLEAREKVLLQISICANNPVNNFWTAGGGEAPAPTAVPELEKTLKELDDAIADLEGDESP